MSDQHPASGFDPRSVTRPDQSLIWYYLVAALPTLVAFPIVFLVLFFKFETLRYRFDDEGISMSWGILFRRETLLTYRRIQDIHVTRNIIQRWMGLATVSVQTASGSSGPEMQIEGIPRYDDLRDFLYTQMRGAKGLAEPGTPQGPAPVAPTPGRSAPDTSDEALALLREIRDHLTRLNPPGGSA